MNTTTMTLRRILGLQMILLKGYFETELESSKLVMTYGYLISNTRIFYDICEPSDIVSL